MHFSVFAVRNVWLYYRHVFFVWYSPYVGVFIISFIFYRLTRVQRCWPRATPDFRSVSAISSFLLYLSRYPKASCANTRHFEVRGAVFKRSSSLLFAFRYSRIYISQFFRLRRPSGAPPGGPSGTPARRIEALSMNALHTAIL